MNHKKMNVEDAVIRLNLNIKLKGEVPLSRVRENEDQGRRYYPPSYIASLTKSIEEIGQLTPVLLAERADKGGYDIIDGHCRIRALINLGRSTVKAIVVQPLTPLEAIKVQRHVQDKHLDHSEYDRTYQVRDALRYAGGNVRLAADALGMTIDQVRTRMRLIELHPKVFEQAVARQIPFSYFWAVGVRFATDALAQHLGMSRDEIVIAMLNKFESKSIRIEPGQQETFRRAADALLSLPRSGAAFWLNDPAQPLDTLFSLANARSRSVRDILNSYIRKLVGAKEEIAKLRVASLDDKPVDELWEKAITDTEYLLRELRLAKKRMATSAKTGDEAA